MQGLGAYPDQTYYDPNRPSWLPYWWDTWSEGVNKYDQLWNQFSYGNPYGDTGKAPVSSTSNNQVVSSLSEIAPYILLAGLGLILAKKVL